ncbi:hypothetical protein BJY52DRAFT_1184210 [Lactarius psammicola]|nr:hypothetical protein BJY52DRAFT_1184210 [Lactarius psammicola]
MGSANSTIPAEPVVAAVAVAGVLGYGYVHYVYPSRAGGTDTDADTNASFLGLSKGSVSTLHGQKKRGRKLQLPGDATLKNLDFLDSSATPLVPAPATRQRQQQTAPQSQGEAVPGGFGGADTSDDALGAPRSPPPLQQQQQQPEQSAGVKKPRKKKGKKTASDPSSTPADAGATPAPGGKAEKAQASASAAVAMADAQDERWTRVEARKKKAMPPQDGLSKLQTTVAVADATTSDAVTTSVTGNSSPVTERTTEDELPSGIDESVPPRVAPVRPLPGEQPAKGFAWEDYEGVQVDRDASSEDDDGWGVVRSRRRPNKTESGSTVTTTAPQPQTKKQRQNAQRREALKEAKRERDTQQQAAFVSHKRELEGARRVDQAAASKRTGSRYDSLNLP